MNPTPKDRLLSYLKHKKLSMSGFAKNCGITKSILSRINENTAQATLSKIESNSDLNIEWLMYGKGEMLNNASTARLLGGVYSSIQGDENVVMVDYIPGTVTASFIEYIGDGNPELDKIAVIKQYGETLDSHHKVFEVIGDSMSPGIPNRAKILTKEISDEKWGSAGGVVVVVFDDEIVVKRIVNNDLNINNSLHLVSDNPKCGDKTIARADIHAMYKAIRIISADIL